MAYSERNGASVIEQTSAPPSPRVLTRGAGWSIGDFVCQLGPEDRPFEERHEQVAIAAVVEGSFRYRSPRGRALLYPGSFLLGDAGACFECGHEHVRGDRCVAFRFDPWFFEEIAAAASGSFRFRFRAPMLPAARGLAALVVEAETALAGANRAPLEELAIRIAERVVSAASGAVESAAAPNAKDARRIGEAVRYIEARAGVPIDLDEIAGRSYMSKYHFLRTFRRVAGVTPYQFLLGARLRRAAVALRTTSAPIGTVAFEAGFGDLSTFNAHFRATFGASPSAFRGAARASRTGGQRREKNRERRA